MIDMLMFLFVMEKCIEKMHEYVAVSVFKYPEVCAILTENVSSNTLE